MPTLRPNERPRILILVALLLGLGVWLARTPEANSQRGVIPTEIRGQLNPPGKSGPLQVPDHPSLRQGQPLTDRTFIELNKIVNPAVVNISTSSLPRGRAMMRDPLLDMFYGPYAGPSQPRAANSLGTGFLISEDGLIITNNHVIEKADTISVQAPTMPDKKFDAKVLGRDQRSDVALLKIEAPGIKFPVAQLGSSRDVEVGENVAAFGNPFGLGNSMTKGIISAKNRPLDEINKFELLQTDALINPGNSGGPLVNIRGLVIGVNTAINAAAQGIGFAIPIDEVKSVIVQLQKYGTVKKGFLGIVPQDLSPQAASYLKLKSLDGALVAMVEPGSPADKAGLKELDVILEFGAKKIRTSGDLRNAAGDAEVGSSHKLKVVRAGREMTLNVTLDEAPQGPRQALRKESPKAPPTVADKQGFGLQLGNLTPEIREQLGIVDKELRGAVVTAVEPGSTAAFAGISPGDVVLQVNGAKVTKPEEALAKLRRGSNAITILRGGAVMSIFIGGD